nr:PBP1A family penicillin-binding protein [uncultured Holophaga sp.]
MPGRSLPRLTLLTLLLGAGLGAQEPMATYPPLPRNQGSLHVMDRQGRWVGRILPKKRYWVSLDRIPPFLQQAVVAVEDARFYEHGGLDYKGLARAVLTDVVKGKMVQGGSTITQQLVKNRYLNADRTLDRKLKEANLAMELEKRYSKAQILEMYLNEIYFGNGVWGIAQAARYYFDKNPEALTEGECVLLAGVPKNPSRYNPFGQAADVAGRRNVVLGRMEDLKLISHDRALALCRTWTNRPGEHAPQVMAEVRRELAARYGADILETGGIDVVTTIDLDIQKEAESALRAGVKRLAPNLQGALVCLDPGNGDVLAAVGDAVGNQDGLNRAFVSRRQSGSAIKPLIYAAALEKGLTAATVKDDEPVAYERGEGKVWKPQNYAGEHLGEVTLRTALAHSDNVIAIKVLDEIGVPTLVDFAERAGLHLHADKGLSLALGTEDVTVEDLVDAYTPLAAGGIRSEARTILRIHDLRQGTWTENAPVQAPVCSPEVAYVTTEMLTDVLKVGTARGLKGFAAIHPSAGKTGTTDNYVDAWFVGYTPSLVTGVWVGADRPRSMGRGFTGGAAAAPIWASFMKQALRHRPSGDFVRPEGVVSCLVDPATGIPVPEGVSEGLQEVFVKGTSPCEAPAGSEAPQSDPGTPQMPPPAGAEENSSAPVDEMP